MGDACLVFRSLNLALREVAAYHRSIKDARHALRQGDLLAHNSSGPFVPREVPPPTDFDALCTYLRDDFDLKLFSIFCLLVKNSIHEDVIVRSFADHFAIIISPSFSDDLLELHELSS